jgi:hypothetical protein
MEANYKTSPLYKYLISLKHSRKTDLSNGAITNPDAIVLFFWVVQQFDVNIKALTEFSNDWRGSDTLAKNYFASNQSCKVGVDFGSRKLPGYEGVPWRKEPKPYWYRTECKPITMALTVDGYIRLSALLKDVEKVLPRPW